MNIVNQYNGKISKIISEPDKGIYDAMNKGVLNATGDIIGILNSDDVYACNSVISNVVKLFANPKVQGSYSDLVYVNREDTEKIIRYWKAKEYKEGMFLKGWMPPHPTFFVRAEQYKKHGLYNTDLSSAADYEMMLRLIHKERIKIAYFPTVTIKMRTGGKSNVTIKNRINANKEDRIAWKLNGLRPRKLTLARKPLSKIFQFFFRT